MERFGGNCEWLTARPIAHRGYHDMNRTIWENTLSAFSRAIEHDFAIECDLQLACDGTPVAFHDHDLQRLCGLPGDVRLLTAAELGMKRVGGTGDTIPTLAALLKTVEGRVPLVMELKGRREGEDDGFAEAVLECLEGYRGQVALMSFSHWILRDLVAAESPWPLGLTAEGTRQEKLFEHEEVMDLGLDFVSYCIEHLPNPFTDGLRLQGMPIIAWTIRTPEMRARSEDCVDQMTFEGFDPNAA